MDADFPKKRSGAMYAGVPRIIPARVVVDGSPLVSRAIPRSSRTRRSSCSSQNTFSGFTSRCTSPESCSMASAPATSSNSATARASGMGPAARRSASVLPRSRGIAM
jgi:hypothetical protein